MRVLIAIMGVLVQVLVVVPRHASAAPTARLLPHSLERTMRSLINHDRAAVGLRPLIGGHRLTTTARLHSLDMASRDYISHITPDGTSPFDRMIQAGVRYRAAGENIGWISGSNMVSMLRRIESTMLSSSEHRANLLCSCFTRIGIGIALTGDQIFITEDFKG